MVKNIKSIVFLSLEKHILIQYTNSEKSREYKVLVSCKNNSVQIYTDKLWLYWKFEKQDREDRMAIKCF